MYLFIKGNAMAAWSMYNAMHWIALHAVKRTSQSADISAIDSGLQARHAVFSDVFSHIAPSYQLPN